MLCILCVKYSDSFLNLFNENGLKLEIAEIIGRHFWFKPLLEKNLAAVICSACWSKVDDFHQFYLSIKGAHTTLSSKVKNEPFDEFELNELLHCDRSPKIEPSEKTCPLPEKSLEHSNEIMNDFCKLEMSCSISGGCTDGESESINPICELDTNKSINEENFYKSDESTDERTEPLKETEIKLRNQPLCKKIQMPKNVTHTIQKDESTKKLKERSSVKSKLDDDAMVKKYIPMNCELCPFIGEKYLSVTKHFRKEHPKVKPYVRCCNKKLFHRQDIVHHAYKHDNPEFFKCKECQKVFSEQTTLSRHMIAAHTSEEVLNFQCDQCPKKFYRQDKLDLHKNSHLPREEETFKCNQCSNSSFATNELLKVHISARHRNAPNVCHVCAKEIRDKASFKKHVRGHYEEVGPKVKCPIKDCDHWLKDEDNLRIHIRRVHEQKAVTCELCGGVYKNKYSLTKHKGRVHSNEIFTCEVCKKTFKRAIYLREHMAQHTGEILYNCQFCTRTFNSRGNMHVHKKKKHPVEWDNWRKTNKSCTK